MNARSKKNYIITILQFVVGRFAATLRTTKSETNRTTENYNYAFL